MPSTIETRAPYRSVGPLPSMPTSKVRNELAGSAVENRTAPAGDTIEAMRFLWTMVAVSDPRADNGSLAVRRLPGP